MKNGSGPKIKAIGIHNTVWYWIFLFFVIKYFCTKLVIFSFFLKFSCFFPLIIYKKILLQRNINKICSRKHLLPNINYAFDCMVIIIYQMVAQNRIRTCSLKLIIGPIQGICLHQQQSSIWRQYVFQFIRSTYASTCCQLNFQGRISSTFFLSLTHSVTPSVGV